MGGGAPGPRRLLTGWPSPPGRAPPESVLRTVLVANRGEIARRIMRACRSLGVRTVAVYSDADADAPHVREADAAVRLGPAPARESYLVLDRLGAAARETLPGALPPPC